MSALLLPLILVVLAWWLATGVILYLDRLPARTFPASLACGGLVAVAGAIVIWQTRGATTPMAAYAGFAGALAVWGWLEMSYLMGLITGTWDRPCPPEVVGWRRFVLAIRTSLYHELSIIAVGVTLWLTIGQGANPTAAWIFIALWFLRWSAKLNIYLGVPNLHEEFLPENQRHLETFFARRPMNLLFPVSITIGTVCLVELIGRALGADPGSHAATAFGLVSIMVFLGILEHWFLVLPLRDAALWRWALERRAAASDRSVVGPPIRDGAAK